MPCVDPHLTRVGCTLEFRCPGGPEKVSDPPLELELQATVSCLTRVLGTELRTSTRAVSALKCPATSPAIKSATF